MNNENLAKLADSYSRNLPFPHIVIDNFLKDSLSRDIGMEFPRENDERWIHFSHYNEDKRALTDSTKMPIKISELISYLSSPGFIDVLQKLTGIKNLIADPSLQGGGIHQTKTGGFLNIHADFTVHPLNRRWRRRVNLLIYLTPNWHESYEGHLELWSKDMKRCVHRISPILNRCVIFNTDEDSYHGVPTPLNCPQNITRNSVALYYYTDETLKIKLRATNYRARPSQDDNKFMIWIDKTIVAAYTRVKSKLRLSDQTTGSILKRLRNKN